MHKLGASTVTTLWRKMSQSSKICCFKDCEDPNIVDRRIEVKTVIPKLAFKENVLKKHLVQWKTNGEAEFHIECWDKVHALSRLRSTKSKPSMIKEEKAMVKIASKAVEQFDSVEKIEAEAKRAAEWLKTANHCVAFTGAGISTSAGIGDYRGKSGKWTEEDQSKAVSQNSLLAGSTDEEEPACKKQKVESSNEGMQENVEEEDDGVPYEKLRPTYTHEALQKLMSSGYLKYITSQNGDGLHGLSGIPSDKISELHGNVFIELCEKCGHRYDRKFYVMDDLGSQYFEEIEDFGTTDVKKPKFAMKCDLCGLSHRTGRKCEQKGCKGFLRDTIINFRDLLEEDVLERARTNFHRCDVTLCLGTTLQVYPAASLVEKRNNSNKLIICNRQETPLDDQFRQVGPEDSPRGCRVFGDCDVFMREMMKHIYSSEELQKWEFEREKRMELYDSLRD